jgi:hypothetical protein
MISIKVKGDLTKTEKYLKRVKKLTLDEYLDAAGMLGVAALAANTPIDTGETAASWSYEIHKGDGVIELVWSNSNTSKGIPIVVLIQYGHATRNGGYVEGRDFINPTVQPIFDQLAKDIWTEVTRG